jgi:hypothetical protein
MFRATGESPKDGLPAGSIGDLNIVGGAPSDEKNLVSGVLSSGDGPARAVVSTPNVDDSYLASRPRFSIETGSLALRLFDFVGGDASW